MSTLTSNVQGLLDKNRAFVADFKPLPTVAEDAARLTTNPSAPRMCIITCCDPRVVPEAIFGLALGDAVVIRSAGGSIEPGLASMLAIDSLAPFTDVIVMRHTDCGTSHWTDEKVRVILKERAGGGDKVVLSRRGEKVDDMRFGESHGHDGDERLLREEVAWMKASPLVREETKGRIVGMIYVTETGEAKVVC